MIRPKNIPQHIKKKGGNGRNIAVIVQNSAEIHFPNLQHFVISQTTMAAKISENDIYIQEQFARIRKHQAEIDKMFDERLTLQQERQLAPWQLAFGGVTAGAALFAAAAAFTKYFL